MMKRYGFVLRLLAQPPEVPTRKLVQILAHDGQGFRECRLFKRWTPLLGRLRIAWENAHGKGQKPAFELRFRGPYRR